MHPKLPLCHGCPAARHCPLAGPALHTRHWLQILAEAAAREAALSEAQAALQRRSAELAADHAARMAKADVAMARLQVRGMTR